MWEDERNKRGGRWLMTLNKQMRRSDLDRFWLETVGLGVSVSALSSHPSQCLYRLLPPYNFPDLNHRWDCLSPLVFLHTIFQLRIYALHLTMSWADDEVTAQSDESNWNLTCSLLNLQSTQWSERSCCSKGHWRGYRHLSSCDLPALTVPSILRLLRAERVYLDFLMTFTLNVFLYVELEARPILTIAHSVKYSVKLSYWVVEGCSVLISELPQLGHFPHRSDHNTFRKNGYKAVG